ncbi:UDP-glucose/GDP-mannose dehydrogenase family protein [Candidatus Trichorickettsia mobilis]|uniref:UDP-glucose 6-dehydrogenase n=1 Tax=Candidatus Trichorickettsia mobilis TaxID=1346319 RepID=A0ABZ0UTT2_9RICK|nr:UDP-glucose/GDP-mannose dehydrogenase family protein [Candidatus Trichorickettsia mobilis]WPY00991.1 UDP-glucose/GDP-mannose dehydrogenase family protein [Candidatus Trichorickettsia mobilis]
MDIAFIGVGYVGLVSGVMMSYLGHNVTCIDTDVFKIEQLQAGILPIYEPGLEEYFKEELYSGKLNFSTQYSAVKKAEVIFITVGTPSLASGAADISGVLDAIHNIQDNINQDRPLLKLAPVEQVLGAFGAQDRNVLNVHEDPSTKVTTQLFTGVEFQNRSSVIVIKSTIPPGTCRNIDNALRIKGKQYHIASNPEFLREGCAVQDFLTPDRIVIGTNDDYAKQILTTLYQPLLARDIPFIWTDLATAELIKYAANSFLATKIAFINEMANICEKIDANITELSLGMGSDHRIGMEFLQAGPGFGGSCFPKDILALSQVAKNYDLDCLVLDATIKANNLRSHDMVKKICNIMGTKLLGQVFAIFGLTFKAGTDDIRDSPAIKIIQLLQAEGAIIRVYDPQIFSPLAGIECINSAIEACVGADAIIITTEWPEFRELDFDIIYQQLKTPIIIDLRNILDVTHLQQKGFKYYAVGRHHGD